MFFKILFLLTSTVTTADLDIKLTATKASLFVGEMTKVRLKWTAMNPIDILPGAVILYIDKGDGFYPYANAGEQDITVVASPIELESGKTYITEYTIGLEENDPSEGFIFVFGKPGQYKVKAVYQTVESNELIIDVTAPTGRDGELLERIEEYKLALTYHVDLREDLKEWLDGVVKEFGPHSYIAPSILERAKIHQSDPEDISRPIFDELYEMDFSDSAFADEFSLIIARMGGSFMGEEWQRQAYQEVIEKFPESLAAANAKRSLINMGGDEISPTLSILVSPSFLWPANRKLVPITVTVEVNDEDDPNPTVKLESITCDPDCDLESDINGADFGTDDREFELRAKLSRKPRIKKPQMFQPPGGSHGKAERAYIITYSAEDSAGNKTTAETEVVVAKRPPFTYVRPIINCVSKTGPKSSTAYFGYKNRSSKSIDIPVGWKNSFTPPPRNRNQPTTFLPGRHDKVFSISIDVPPPLIWHLGVGKAMAHRRTKRCE